MDTFYLIVLGVATLVLILMLAFLGWNMSQVKKGSRYPTITTTCPDNWTAETRTIGDAKMLVCTRPTEGEYNRGGANSEKGNVAPYNVSLASFMTNEKTGDKTNGDYIRPTSEEWGKYNNKNPTCEKRDWAKAYGIRWDSVESANYCE